jgi:predicted membrane-bound spermidine synthase
MDDALRRRLDAVVALLAVVAVVSVTALWLSFGSAGILTAVVMAVGVSFVGVIVGLFVNAELR